MAAAAVPGSRRGRATRRGTAADGRQLEFSATALAAVLEQRAPDDPATDALAARLRRAHAGLGTARRTPAEWSARCSAALAALGWPGPRTLSSDEQQTVARWQSLLDEYAALGAWLPTQDLDAAVATLADLAAERYFDPASVEAPVTLTNSQDDPIVRYDAIWVAGLDAAQWPASARPDVFIPLAMQRAARIPTASAAGQTTSRRVRLPRGAQARRKWFVPGRAWKGMRIVHRVRCSRESRIPWSIGPAPVR